MEFEVVDLTSWIRGEREPGGDEEKRWFGAPADASEGALVVQAATVVELSCHGCDGSEGMNRIS